LHHDIYWENITAPITTRKNMAVTFAESTRDSVKFFLLYLLITSPMMRAPKAPTAPPSLGENVPAYMPPTTTTVRISTGRILLVEINLGPLLWVDFVDFPMLSLVAVIIRRYEK